MKTSQHLNPELLPEAAGDAVALLSGVPQSNEHHPLAAEAAAVGLKDLMASLTTSDLALSSAAGFGAVIGLAYETNNDYRKLCRDIFPSDYMPNQFANPDIGLDDSAFDMPAPEHSEGVHASVKVGLSDPVGLQAKTIVVSITREVVINDIGVAPYILASIGALIARRERRAVFGILAANSALPDTRNLFNTTDENDLGVGALSLTTLGAGFAAMRHQKTLAGNECGFRPRFLIVSPEAELLALSLVKQITTDGATAPLEVIAANEISGDAWYLAADPAQAPALGFLSLGGSLGKTFKVRAGERFNSSSPRYAVDHVFNTVALGRVGLVRGGV